MNNELKQLKKELPYKWRVQSANEYNAICVAYIDSRDVQDLLDEVVGEENWQSDYKEVKGNVYAGIGILCNEQWVWKWDCGVESKTEAEKGEASDSFKRAAVKWGIGRFLYALDVRKLKTKPYKDKHYPVDGKGEILWDKESLTTYINNLNQVPDKIVPPKRATNGEVVKTTLHNHKELGTDEKPLISNADFKQLCEDARHGLLGKIQNAKQRYSFDHTQQQLINQLYLEATKQTS